MEAENREIGPEEVSAARKMFLGGFALLPWLWLVNYIHYRGDLGNPSAPPAFKKHVKGSLYGFIAFMVLWAGWLFYYYSGDGGWRDSLRVVSSNTQTF